MPNGVGHLELSDERLLDGLRCGESLLRSPQSLPDLLEAAGQVAPERAGAILDARVCQTFMTRPTHGSTVATHGSMIATRGSETPRLGSAAAPLGGVAAQKRENTVYAVVDENQPC